MNKEDNVKERDGESGLTIPELRLWHSDMEIVGAIVAVLLVLGSINVFSSSFVMAERDFGSPYFFIQRHGLSMVIAWILGYVCYRVDYHKYGFLIPFITIALLIALVSVFFFSVEINGAKRWIALFGVSAMTFQPAEFAKLICIIIMANYLYYKIKRGETPTLIEPRMGIFILIAGLIYLEPDMGTAAIVIGIPLIMMIIVGMSSLEFYTMSVLGVFGVLAMVFSSSYRIERIKVWFDPFADAMDKGYQTVRSLTAIGSGGWGGMGLGDGISKYFDLPEAHTDFAFAVFSQENGYWMVLVVVMLYAALAIYIMRIAQLAKDVFGQILAVGIMWLIVGQAFANMLMVSGVLPVIGVPLPFISYGGSSLMVSLMAVGILMNIAKQADQVRKDKIRKLRAEEKAARPKRKPPLRLVKT